MAILVCGSMAYDTIMVFPDRFKHHILPEQIHILNVAFLVPEMRREFGGCAGNIAYGLNLLGAQPLIMATVGDDCGPYRARLAALGISDHHVQTVPGSFTAQAFITTDLDDNQITAFHPGAMNASHRNEVAAAKDVTLGIVAPDGREGMLAHVDQFAAAGIPFVFDPGQGMPMFSGDELLYCLERATYCTLNDYEAQMMSEKTGLSLELLARRVYALVVTRGGEGAHLYVDGQRTEIAPVRAAELVDPTGCGDAFRAGLLHGIEQQFDLVKATRLAAVMGAIKIGSRGGQNYAPTRAQISAMFQAAWGEVL